MYKFRAYQDGVYFYSDQQDCDVWFEIGPDGICLVLNEQRHETGSGVAEEYWVRVHYPDIEIDQFIGLTNNDGIDLYTNDIVKADGVNQVIVFRDDMQMFCMRLNGTSGTTSIPKNSKIIGTVNENPELLNEPKGNDNDTSTNT